MKFCPECGSILMPKKGTLKCASCGYTENLSKGDSDKEYKFKGSLNKEQKVTVINGEDLELANTKITCYKCGGTKGYTWTVQTRSADEAPTFFVRCAKCGNTWRRSN